MQHCANRKCKTKSLKEDGKASKGCPIACKLCKNRKYCSKACMVDDWTNGHSEECRRAYQSQLKKIESECVYLTEGQLLSKEEATVAYIKSSFPSSEYEAFNVEGKSSCILGKTQHGTVYLMREKKTKTLYAVEVIEKETIPSPASLAAVHEGILQHLRLAHANILKLRRCFEESSRIYLIYEYPKAGSLAELLVRKKRLSEAEAFHFFTQIVNAAHFLLKNHISFMEVNPWNVLLAEHGVVKMSVFGCWSQHEAEGKGFQKDEDCVAPEKIRRSSYTPKTIVWELGALLFKMLYGKQPYTGASETEVFEKTLATSIEFDSKATVDAQELIKVMLLDDANLRPSIVELFTYNWMKRLQGEFGGHKKVAIDPKAKTVLKKVPEPAALPLAHKETAAVKAQYPKRPVTVMLKKIISQSFFDALEEGVAQTPQVSVMKKTTIFKEVPPHLVYDYPVYADPVRRVKASPAVKYTPLRSSALSTAACLKTQKKDQNNNRTSFWGSVFNLTSEEGL